MRMSCSTNMYNSKRLYWFEQNNLTYLDCDEDCFNNDKCDPKVKNVLGM